jgi:Subtilase family
VTTPRRRPKGWVWGYVGSRVVWSAACLAVALTAPACSWFDGDEEGKGETSSSEGIPAHSEQGSTENIALMDAETLWRELEASSEGSETDGRRILVTLKDPGENRGFYDGRVLITRDEYDSARESVLESVDGLSAVEDRPIELTSGADLPTFSAEIDSADTLAELLNSEHVDFVEPEVIPMESNCGQTDRYVRSSDPRAEDQPLPGAPYNGADLVPYTYRLLGVQDAWKRLAGPGTGHSPVAIPGQGQRIAVLDTGVSDAQEQFFSRYAAYYHRAPLFRQNYNPAAPENDTCSHGTKAASIAAAPRDGRSIVGIAWGASLMVMKVTGYPFVRDDAEPTRLTGTVPGVCKAIRDAVAPPTGGRPASVVSMAFGLAYYSPALAECIHNAYEESPHTIFIAAAGSRLSTVVYPASDPHVLGISLVEFRTFGGDPMGYRQIDAVTKLVAYGDQVDFVAVDDHGTGMPASGLVGNEREDRIGPFGETSAAVSMYAGLIAVASQYAESQGWSRKQLLSVLEKASSRAGIVGPPTGGPRDTGPGGGPPTGDPAFDIGPPSGVGAGILDLYRAIGGARSASIEGPTAAQPGANVVFSASVGTATPPGVTPENHFEYRWTVNAQPVAGDRNLRFQIPLASSGTGRIVVSLEVTDTVDGNVLYANHVAQITG